MVNMQATADLLGAGELPPPPPLDAGDTIGQPKDWQHGDDPTLHPMWEIQLDLEYGMMRAGANKLRDQVVTATERGQMTQVGVVRNLLTEWLPGVAEEIKDWVKSWERKKGGVKPAVLPIMKTLDPHMAALVGLREIMDRIGYASSTANTVQNISMEIGRTIEYELRVRAWEKSSDHDKALLAVVRQRMEKDKVTSGHRRRVQINRFNHHLSEGHFEDLTWEPWNLETIFRVGWEVMDCVVRFTGWFECIPDPDHIYRKGVKRDPKLLLIVKPGLTDWLNKALDKAELNQPDFRPTVMPPKPWTSSRNGGYWTPYVKPPRLVRFKASQEHQKANAADEYDAFDMPKVYRAINMLQDTPYAVNKRVLDVFQKSWLEMRWSSQKGCLPELTDRDLPPITARMDALNQLNAGRPRKQWIEPDEETAQEIFEWKKRAAPIHAFNGRRASRVKATSTTLRIATEFSQYETIYFPHMLDFRGRIYPIPAYLQPQGNDLARGLLTYATEAPITEENGGIRWLAIHLASNWGHDKLSFEDREKWVYENEALLRGIAEDPYSNDDWFRADKPWQVLAAIFEWVDYLDTAATGEVFYSSLPIMVDGTCNGLQHLSAIIRDEVAGEHVNLMPGEKPRDIYKFVAHELQLILERIASAGGEQGELATWWLDLCGGELPRTLTKRQVMVLPYGGTKDSFMNYTRKWLEEKMGAYAEWSDGDKAAASTRIHFLALHMWETVKVHVRAATEVMDWIQKCARVAANADQPIFWTTPSGFVVRHFYGVIKEKRIDLKLDGQRHMIQIGERTAALSLKEQLQGIAPNFIHSLDASCLVDCLNACFEDGITAFSSVHDAYGTHAGNMERLSELLREAFVLTHETDVLATLRLACLEVAVPALMIKEKQDDALKAYNAVNDQMPQPLRHGRLDLQSVRRSRYFFA